VCSEAQICTESSSSDRKTDTIQRIPPGGAVDGALFGLRPQALCLYNNQEIVVVEEGSICG